MTLEDLRIFVAAAEAGSMGELARSLGRTQPAVAHHVRRLEQEFSTPLLERSRRGVALTEAGRALYDRATAALAVLGTAEAEVARLRGDTEGKLAIAASSGMVRHVLKPAVLELRRRKPQVDFRIACSNTVDEQLASVRERRADLAFVALAAEAPGFEFLPAVDLSYSLLVHTDDSWSQRRRIGLERLAEASLIAVGRDSPTSAFVEARLGELGVSPAIAHTVETEGTAVLYVELGLGQVVLPSVQAAALAERSELRALPIQGLPPMSLGWAARSFELLSDAAQEFLTLFQRSASTLSTSISN